MALKFEFESADEVILADEELPANAPMNKSILKVAKSVKERCKIQDATKAIIDLERLLEKDPHKAIKSLYGLLKGLSLEDLNAFQKSINPKGKSAFGVIDFATMKESENFEAAVTRAIAILLKDSKLPFNTVNASNIINFVKKYDYVIADIPMTPKNCEIFVNEFTKRVENDKTIRELANLLGYSFKPLEKPASKPKVTFEPKPPAFTKADLQHQIETLWEEFSAFLEKHRQDYSFLTMLNGLFTIEGEKGKYMDCLNKYHELSRFDPSILKNKFYKVLASLAHSKFNIA